MTLVLPVESFLKPLVLLQLVVSFSFLPWSPVLLSFRVMFIISLSTPDWYLGLLISRSLYLCSSFAIKS